jgi:hypothetical protein
VTDVERLYVTRQDEHIGSFRLTDRGTGETPAPYRRRPDRRVADTPEDLSDLPSEPGCRDVTQGPETRTLPARS